MLILHGYWLSLATYRVRAALFIKGIAFEERMHDLSKGDQHTDRFRSLNPAGTVPALEGAAPFPLTQSLAIMEWLEETYPSKPLLPLDPDGRARVRSLFLLTAADTHPLVVPRVSARLAEQFGADGDAHRAWSAHWFHEGMAAYEAQMVADSVRCYDNQLSIADLALVSHLAGAERFGVDVSEFPRVENICRDLLLIPEIAAAHPQLQAR